MAVFLFLLVLAVLVEFLLVVPAVLALLMQFRLRAGLAKDYPEDWRRYMLIFIAYEVLVSILLMLIYWILSAGPILSLTQGFDAGRLYGMMMLILLILISTVVMQFTFRRSYCFGTVLFSARDWVGVEVRSDFFSKVQSGDYAVKNPRGLSLKVGDRVRVGIEKKPMAKPQPKTVQAKADSMSGDEVVRLNAGRSR